MARRTIAEVRYMLEKWAEARENGYFEGQGHKGGVLSDEQTARSQGAEKSNAAQVACLTKARRMDGGAADDVQKAMGIIWKHSPTQLVCLQYRYLAKGSWEEQARDLAKVMPGVTLKAYRAHADSALYMIEAELIEVRDGDEETMMKRQHRGVAR